MSACQASVLRPFLEQHMGTRNCFITSQTMEPPKSELCTQTGNSSPAKVSFTSYSAQEPFCWKGQGLTVGLSARQAQIYRNKAATRQVI